MKTSRENLVIAWISICLSILIAIVSLSGILAPDFYKDETRNWQVQSIGQDFIDLLLVSPVLLITSIILFRTSRALLILQGILLYTTYTFTIYCFSVHFNALFPLYCIILGTAFYLCIHFVYRIEQSIKITIAKNSVRNATAVYFITISILFYLLWLSDIIPPILNGTIPETLAQAGLITNPVHAIDLAVFLPGLFIIGILILKNRLSGFAMAPAMLTFLILMNITIMSLNIMMVQQDVEESTAVAGIMAALTLFSFSLLIAFWKTMHYDEKA